MIQIWKEYFLNAWKQQVLSNYWISILKKTY